MAALRVSRNITAGDGGVAGCINICGYPISSACKKAGLRDANGEYDRAMIPGSAEKGHDEGKRSGTWGISETVLQRGSIPGVSNIAALADWLCLPSNVTAVMDTSCPTDDTSVPNAAIRPR